MGFMSDTIEHIEHETSHMWSERTDYCPRALVADSSRGFYGQVEYLMSCVLSPDDKARVEEMLGEPWESAGHSYTADAIESLGCYEWSDGDVYYMLPCPFRHVE